MSPVCSQPSRRAWAVAASILPVAAHDQIAADQNLAVLGDPDLDAVERRADGVELGATRRLALITGARLGLAIALQHRQAERVEEQAHIQVERRTTRDHSLEPATESLLDLAANQAVERQIDAGRDAAAARPSR